MDTITKGMLIDFYMEDRGHGMGGDVFYHIYIDDDNEHTGWIERCDFQEMLLKTEDLSDHLFYMEEACKYGYISKRKAYMLHDYFYAITREDRIELIIRFINDHSDIRERLMAYLPSNAVL